MPAPVQTITPAHINFGKANLFLGVTLPAEGDFLVIDSNGAPPDGTFLGATASDLIFHYTPTLVPIMVEQHTAAIDAVVTERVAEIEAELSEQTAAKLDKILAAGTLIGDLYIMGDKLLPTFQSVVAVQRRRDTTTTYSHVMLYSTYPIEPLSLPLSRTKASTYKVRFRAVAVTTRVQTDRLFQVYNPLT